ncbi:HipA N-terminal domain-containing protein [Halomonas sp.]|uniref:HipA N-terminal domain-containing protein n=1 Tax=Halomonas sp. TaxID=1486246 RepID=UPI003D127811
MAGDDTLEVYHGDKHVGRLHDAQPLRFEYAPAWLEHPEAVSLSPTLPLSQQVHVGDAVLAYFENLLPEGDLLDVLPSLSCLGSCRLRRKGRGFLRRSGAALSRS